MDTSPLPTAAPRPVVLCILDGWGYRAEREDNALAQAHLPVWTRLLAECPHALVATSGTDVGLPDGQMGNSEVGHMNIGAGRILTQELPRIDLAIADNSIAQNTALNGLKVSLAATGGTCHLFGLVSPGGVHSHQDHLAAFARMLDGAGIPVRIHAFLDGRDTPPQSALGFMEKFLGDIASLKNTRVATVGGRYYGMDRDKRWERIEKAYSVIVDAKGPRAADPLSAIRASYAANVTDEFMIPVVMPDYTGMQDGDGVLMGNFRADRVRQMSTALLDPAFDGFTRTRQIRFGASVSLTEYSKALTKFMAVMFPPQEAANTLGEIVSRKGLTQLRIAETEKYAHVTFFLNGGAEAEFPGESRIMIPSPKVATYDLQPEMSAPEVTDKIVDAIENRRFDVIIVNYANGDMVGHSGILAAAIKAAEAIDAALGRLETALKKAGGAMIISADHGNLEMMRDPNSHEPHTQHTLGPVPVVLVNGPEDVNALSDGRLSDLAPTVLDLLQIAKPAEMTGRSLLNHRAAPRSGGSGQKSATA